MRMKLNSVKSNINNESDTFSIFTLFITWLQIGCTSFGGGATTQYLIQEKFIYKHKWITSDEYANIIAVCQITPGTNIIAYTILIGKKLGGWIGILVSLIGLILPSAFIIVILTSFYTYISKSRMVHSGLHTVFAAIFGISLATSCRNVRPIFIKNYKRGRFIFIITIAIIVGSGAIYILFNLSVILLYILGGLCGAVAYWYISKDKERN